MPQMRLRDGFAFIALFIAAATFGNGPRGWVEDLSHLTNPNLCVWGMSQSENLTQEWFNGVNIPATLHDASEPGQHLRLVAGNLANYWSLTDGDLGISPSQCDLVIAWQSTCAGNSFKCQQGDTWNPDVNYQNDLAKGFYETFLYDANGLVNHVSPGTPIILACRMNGALSHIHPEPYAESMCDYVIELAQADDQIVGVLDNWQPVCTGGDTDYCASPGDFLPDGSHPSASGARQLLDVVIEPALQAALDGDGGEPPVDPCDDDPTLPECQEPPEAPTVTLVNAGTGLFELDVDATCGGEDVTAGDLYVTASGSLEFGQFHQCSNEGGSSNQFGCLAFGSCKDNL